MRRRFPLILGFLALTACDLFKSPGAPVPAGEEIRYTAIGASDAMGIGGSVSCTPFSACPTGTGYVFVLVRKLRIESRAVTLVNLGVPGAVLSPEVEALGDSLGRGIPANVLENVVPFVPRDSTLVTVFVGANDANTIGAAAEAGKGGGNRDGFVRAQTRSFDRDLRALVAGIRERADGARIIVFNLPNLAALPYASGYTPTQKRGLQEIAVGFSARINTLASLGALVIDLMCDSRFYQPGIYSSDGLHPNDSGYALFADLAFQAATAGSVLPPQSSCPQMAIF